MSGLRADHSTSRHGGDGDRGPNVLYFGRSAEVAELYRAHLPESWRLSTLPRGCGTQEELRFIAEADALIHTDALLTSEHLAAAGRLALVQRQGVGLDTLDLPALRDRDVAVAVCPDGSAEAVAEHTLLLMLAAGRHLVQLHQQTQGGAWPKWAYRQISTGLQGAVVGIVGFGRIGRAVARRVLAFDSEVLVHRRDGSPLGEEWEETPTNTCASLDELFRRSDVVTLHCPLLPETRGMVDARLLGLMKPTAILVNTARGGLVVEEDLVTALRSGRPAAAGLDVLSAEPPPADHPLLDLPNVVLTPHCAAGTRQAQVVKIRAVLANIGRMWAGEPLHDRVV